MPSNHFTTSNLAASDVVEDTPTDNYCVLNALDKYSSVTLSEGNLKLTASDYHYARSTFALPSSGKWYWEYYWKDNGYIGGYGIAAADYDLNDGSTGKCRMVHGGSYFADFFSGNALFANDQHRNSATSWVATTPTSNYADGDIVMVAVDRDNSKIWFGKNGDWIETSGTPNPATGADPRNSSVTSATDWFPTLGTSSTYSGEVYANYGQDPFFAGNKTSGQDTSQSEFYYAPPSGFKSLSTGNLATPAIAKPSEHFDVLTYTANGTAGRSLTGLGHQPDLLWAKERNAVAHHVLLDSVRTASAGRLSSNRTNVEDATTALASFDANGFTVGSSYAHLNSSTTNYVAWSWKKSATAGMDIVTWTGNDDGTGASPTPQAVSHGLNVAPELVIAKSRTQNTFNNFNWVVWHKDLSSANYLLLNGNGAETGWGDALVSSIGSSSVSFGSDAMMSGEDLNADSSFGSADTYVAYLFASVEGYSKVGSYEGNNSTDGPFVYCGFRPRWICVKRIDGTSPWVIIDTARDPYNDTDATLAADTSSAESSYAATSDFDILSNGFKLRHSVTYGYANNADTYIFLAMAESPLKTANAR